MLVRVLLGLLAVARGTPWVSSEPLLPVPIPIPFQTPSSSASSNYGIPRSDYTALQHGISSSTSIANDFLSSIIRFGLSIHDAARATFGYGDSTSSGYGYEAPNTGYVPPASEYGTPAYEYKPPASEYGTPAYEYKPPADEYKPPVSEYVTPTDEYKPPISEYVTPTDEYKPPVSEYVTPTDEYKPPVSEYVTPTDEYKPPVSEYVTPTDEYKPPVSEYVTPTDEYKPPVSEYVTPTDEYKPPVSEYVTPTDEYKLPGSEYVTPANEYEPSTYDYSPPAEKYGTPETEYDPPKNEYGTPENGYKPPKSEYGLPSNGYLPPPNEYKPPEDEYGSPEDEYVPTENYYVPPKTQYSSPDNEHDEHGPSGNEYVPPEDEYVPPKTEYVTPENEYAVPDNEYGVPENEEKDDSDHYIAIITYPDTPAPTYIIPVDDYKEPINDYQEHSEGPSVTVEEAQLIGQSKFTTGHVIPLTSQQVYTDSTTPSSAYTTPATNYSPALKHATSPPSYTTSAPSYTTSKPSYTTSVPTYTTKAPSYTSTNSYTTPMPSYTTKSHYNSAFPKRNPFSTSPHYAKDSTLTSSTHFSFPNNKGHGTRPTGHSNIAIIFGEPLRELRPNFNNLKVSRQSRYRGDLRSPATSLFLNVSPHRSGLRKRKTTLPERPRVAVSQSSSTVNGFRPIITTTLRPTSAGFRLPNVNHLRHSGSTPTPPTVTYDRTTEEASDQLSRPRHNLTLSHPSSTLQPHRTTTGGHSFTTPHSPLLRIVLGNPQLHLPRDIVSKAPPHNQNRNAAPIRPGHGINQPTHPAHGVQVFHKGVPDVRVQIPAHTPVHTPVHTTPAPHSAQVHGTYGKSQYHFSWKALPGQVFTWNKGDEYCTSLGPGWELVSLELPDENFYISQVVAKENVKYIWLGGFREPGSRFFVWLSGGGFKGYNWSSTGGRGVPQPDNREGNEYYIALLNNFYKDGIKWHDIANSHEKPVICERRNPGPHNAHV
ncbi:hypothetical protein O3P69_014916 [Scylla paramamosain]|uniref:C-type lectin domain-containing protein n=1 Tax=Scylla paramamosain TaxID=85552 RepID=A0AAW0TYE7_SCYPA